MRIGIIIATAAALVATGFLFGWSLGGSDARRSFGTQPQSISQPQAEVRVPSFSPGGKLPPIETVVLETTVESESLEEPISSTPVIVVPEKKEQVKSPPPSGPTPDVTVGESE